MARCGTITRQNSRKWKKLRNEQATSQRHTQTVKIYSGNDEPRTVHYDMYTLAEAKEPDMSDGSDNGDDALVACISASSTCLSVGE